MYVRTISVRNIKCFQDLTLDFTDPDGDLPVRRWSVLLGENGVGKSALLQALAVALAGPGATRELLPIADGWVRHPHGYGEIDATLLPTPGDMLPPKGPQATHYTPKFLVCGPDPTRLPPELPEVDRPTVASIIHWPGRGAPPEREAANRELGYLEQTAYAEHGSGWLACGYGPFPESRPEFEAYMFAWENRLTACQKCNQDKWRHFPQCGDRPCLLDPTGDTPSEHIAFENERAAHLTDRGRCTIDLIGLNRDPIIGARAHWLMLIKTLLLLLCHEQARGSARRLLVWAMQADASYSAMTSEYLRRKVPRLACPATPHPRVILEDPLQQIAQLIEQYAPYISSLE